MALINDNYAKAGIKKKITIIKIKNRDSERKAGDS